MKNGDKLIVYFWVTLLIFICIMAYIEIKIEHEKTIQKAIECGYQPLCIGGTHWNKGD